MSSTASTPAPPSLGGRTVLVTGAGGGLGAATAQAAGAAGAEVILLGRNVRNLEAVYDAIVDAGGPDPGIVPVDLEGASPDDYLDIAGRIETQCGRLHALVHNAAITGPLTPIEQYPPLEWMRVMQVNLHAPMLLTQACLPLLRHDEDPRILFIGDERRRGYWGAYGVSKAGLDALAAILDDELKGRYPIAVDTFCPEPMRTGMRIRAFPGELPGEVPGPEASAQEIVRRLAPSSADD